MTQLFIKEKDQRINSSIEAKLKKIRFSIKCDKK